MVKGLSVNREFLVRFHYGWENNFTLNQLTAVTLYWRPVIKEAEVPAIYVIPDGAVDLDKGFYHGVYFLLQFNKDCGVNIKEDQAETESYLDEY